MAVSFIERMIYAWIAPIIDARVALALAGVVDEARSAKGSEADYVLRSNEELLLSRGDQLWLVKSNGQRLKIKPQGQAA